MPAHIVNETRSMWIELRHQTKDSSLRPVGLEFRVNVTSLCPCYWIVDYVWFRNFTFANMQQLKRAYDNDPLVRERLKQYANLGFIRRLL